jgi:hypothetical protein
MFRTFPPTVLPAFLLLLLPRVLSSAALSDTTAARFAQTLIRQDSALAEFVLPEELARSTRLGIEYRGVRHKFLIGYDLDPRVRQALKADSTGLRFEVRPLEEDYSLLTLRLPAQGYEKSFYFKGSRLVSPVYYHTRHWQRRESRHFIFLLSDPASFNDCAESRLEEFLDSTMNVLGLDAAQRGRLEREKLVYVRCRDEDEIERLTGFRIRGMGVLAYDYVVTVFNCHYHELLHLLLNYRLGTASLEVHPFLQEGFATALGGRGGQEPPLLRDLGAFLSRSGLLGYRELLDREGYLNQDPSLAYPVAGLYNFFLLDRLGLDRYLALYARYSSPDGVSPAPSTVREADLPPAADWKGYLGAYRGSGAVSAGAGGEKGRLILSRDGQRVYDCGENYLFQCSDSLVLSSGDPAVFPAGRYLVVARPEEVSVYCLPTGNLIAAYVLSLSVDLPPVPEKDGRLEFRVKKSLFREPLDRLRIR